MCNGRKLALLAGVALVLGLAPMLPASADVVLNKRIPIALTVFNPCTGELVDVTGEGHIVITEVGQGCFNAQSNLHLTGVGQTSGLQYELNANQHETLCDPDPATCGFTLTNTIRERFISLGSADNLVIVIRETITQNPDCSFDGEHDFALECQR
jgi:hypothetical protein